MCRVAWNIKWKYILNVGQIDLSLGDEIRDPEVLNINAFEQLQVNEMHTKREVLILKGKDRRTNLIDEADQKKDVKRDQSLASKVSRELLK